MPWCPKCKTEYRDGFTTCADCNVELVEELETLDKTNDYEEVIALEEETTAKKLVEFLTFSQVTAYFEYSEVNKAYSVYAPHAEIKKAKRCFEAFYKVELENMESSTPASYILDEEPLQSLSDNTESETDENNEIFESLNAAEVEEESFNDQVISEDTVDNLANTDLEETYDTLESCNSYDFNATDVEYSNVDDDFILDEVSDHGTSKKFHDKEDENDLIKVTTPAYVKKSDQYKDLKSTAITFLLFGFGGLIFVALNVFGTISIINGTFGYIIMSLVFLGFILVGINSISRSKKAAADAILEEELTSNINAWLKENISEEYIQRIQDNSLSSEVNFIKTMDHLKEMVTKALGEMDDSYLEYVIEEYYNKHFDSLE